MALQSIQATDSSALLYITDEYSYKELTEKLDFFEGEPVKFSNDFYEYCVDESGFYATPKGLQISCRRIENTTIENDKNIDIHYDQASRVISALQRELGKQESIENSK